MTTQPERQDGDATRDREVAAAMTVAARNHAISITADDIGILARAQPARDGAEGAGEPVLRHHANETLEEQEYLLAKVAPPKPAPDAMRVLMDEVRTIRATCGFLNESEATRLGAIAERCDDILSAPVPPVDGDKRVKLSLVIEALESAANDARKKNISGFMALTDIAILFKRGVPSGTGAAEPVAWRMFDTAGSVLTRSYNTLTITCEDGDTANRIADQLRTAAPPVRGDRETLDRQLEAKLDDYWKGRPGPSLAGLIQWWRNERASLPVQPGAGERRWYLASQNDGLFIINAEPRPSNDDQWHDRPDGPSIVLNVTELPEAKAIKIVGVMNELSRQAPHSSSEGGR